MPAALRTYHEQLLALAKARPFNAFDQIVALNTNSESQIEKIVGESAVTAHEPLRAALGEEAFDRYEREFKLERMSPTIGGPVGDHGVPGDPISGGEPRGERSGEARPKPPPQRPAVEIP